MSNWFLLNEITACRRSFERESALIRRVCGPNGFQEIDTIYYLDYFLVHRHLGVESLQVSPPLNTKVWNAKITKTLDALTKKTSRMGITMPPLFQLM